MIELWVAGQVHGMLGKVPDWSIQGVFDSEQKAVAACGDHLIWFVAPLILNEVLPEERCDWPGIYYPNDPSLVKGKK